MAALDVTAVAGIVIGIGAAASAMALPLKYPNAPKSVLEASWWGGISLIAAGAAWVAVEHHASFVMTASRLIGIGVVGAATFAGLALIGIIWQSREAMKTSPSHETAALAGEPSIPRSSVRNLTPGERDRLTTILYDLSEIIHKQAEPLALAS